MALVRGSQRALAHVDGLVVAGVRAPDRVYVRAEQRGRVRLLLWGMEHAGLRSEVVESSLPGRPAATWAIERDLRRGVGL
jgi:hypothetical protein